MLSLLLLLSLGGAEAQNSVVITRPGVFGYDWEMNVCQQPDGSYTLQDEERKIYTLDSRKLPIDQSAYKDADGKLDTRRYILDNCKPMVVGQQDNLLILDSVIVTRYADDVMVGGCSLYYTNSKGDWYSAVTQELTWDDEEAGLPYRFDMRGFSVQMGYPCNMAFSWSDDKTHTSPYISLDATTPGVYPFVVTDTDGREVLAGKYYVGHAHNFAYDIHGGMEQTYDFYKQVLNRDSYDGKGTPIYNLAYSPTAGRGNAAASFLDPRFCYMLYGMDARYPCVAIDVMAHEYTHLVAMSSSGLDNKGESGALGEAFSDMMGIAVKQRALGKPHNWMLGDDLFGGKDCTRNLADPLSKGKPAVYEGKYWLPLFDNYLMDATSIHADCTVATYWFYLLCEGGEGHPKDDKTVSVEGIGSEKAVQIAYRTLTEKLTATSNFADAREGSISAAIDLYGSDSQECRSVRNAWAAVGVGDPATGIELVEKGTAPQSINRFAIYTADGKTVRSGDGQPSLQSLPAGIYVVNMVYADGSVKRAKVVKK